MTKQEKKDASTAACFREKAFIIGKIVALKDANITAGDTPDSRNLTARLIESFQSDMQNADDRLFLIHGAIDLGII